MKYVISIYEIHKEKDSLKGGVVKTSPLIYEKEIDIIHREAN